MSRKRKLIIILAAAVSLFSLSGCFLSPLFYGKQTHRLEISFRGTENLSSPDTLTLYAGDGSELATFSTADGDATFDYDELGETEQLVLHSEYLDKDMYFDTLEQMYDWYYEDAHGAGEPAPAHDKFIWHRNNEIVIDYETGLYSTWWLDYDETK